MRSGRTALLAALSVLVAGLLVPLSTAARAEVGRDSPAGRVGQVLPVPQSVRVRGGWLPVPAEVGVVAAPGTDPATVEVVAAALRAAGARRVVPAARPALTVRVGGGPAPAGLPAGGDELVTRRGRGTLSGVDGDGLFHAAQTLRQLAAGDALPLGSIPGRPAMSWR